MPIKKIPPILGIDNTREAAALERGGQNPSVHLRDAVNVDISETGRIQMRPGVAKVTEQSFKWLWQSPLHGDCFAVLGQDWVKVNPDDWTYDVLIQDVAIGRVEFMVLNNVVLMASQQGLYQYNGTIARTFCIETPSPPLVEVSNTHTGSLAAGDYCIAISWLRDGQESGLSALTNINVQANSAINVILPYCFDDSITHVKVYITETLGGELREIEQLQIGQTQYHVISLDQLSRSATQQHLVPMRTGHSLGLFRGRLMVADRNVLYFSEAMNYHLMDARYNFVQFAQRIRFALAVDGGIWIGQQDHVLFLQGTDLKTFSIQPKVTQPPIAHSGVLLNSNQIDAELSQGGASTALWLAANGYVVGTASGQVVELHRSHLSQITALQGQSVGFGKRVFTLVT